MRTGRATTATATGILTAVMNPVPGGPMKVKPIATANAGLTAMTTTDKKNTNYI